MINVFSEPSHYLLTYLLTYFLRLALISSFCSRQIIFIFLNFYVITSANKIAEVTWYPLSVRLSVCLSVRYLKKVIDGFELFLWNDRSSAKDQSIRFWHWSGSGWILHFFNMERQGVFRHWTGLHRRLWMNVHEIFRRARPPDKEHLIKFWDWSGFHFPTFPSVIKYELKEFRMNF